MITTLPFNPYSKERQLQRKRIRPTQRQKGNIRTKVDRELKDRSGGVCEVRMRCDGSRAYERAHITGRKQIGHVTTANDLLHVCVPCHRWLDETIEGIRYRKKLREG